MTLILIYLTIAATGLLILFTLTAVLVRRAYMKIRYARLDEARAMFAGLSERIDPDAGSIDLNQYRKKPGTLEWQAIEEALFKSLDTLNVGAHSSSPSLQTLQGPAQKTLKLFDALGFTDYYIDRLRRGSRWDKALAADKLGRTGCGRAVPHLVEALNSDYRDVRNLSVYALGLIHDKSAIPHLIGLMRRGTQEDFSARIVKSALISFGESAVPALIEEIKRPVWQFRASCVDILGEIPCQEACHALRNALKDPEQDVRAKAAKGAGKLKDRGALAGLIALLADPHWVVRLHAARALGLIGDIAAIAHIKARLNDENWQVRRVAAEALGRFGGAAYPALMEVSLKGSDRYAREQADDELERAGVLKAVIKTMLFYKDKWPEAAGHPSEGWVEEAGGMEKGTLINIVRLLAGAGHIKLKEVLTAAAGRDASWFDIEDAVVEIERFAREHSAHR